MFRRLQKIAINISQWITWFAAHLARTNWPFLPVLDYFLDKSHPKERLRGSDLDLLSEFPIQLEMIVMFIRIHNKTPFHYTHLALFFGSFELLLFECILRIFEQLLYFLGHDSIRTKIHTNYSIICKILLAFIFIGSLCVQAKILLTFSIGITLRLWSYNSSVNSSISTYYCMYRALFE